jgi:hypothetical protein
VLVPLRHAAWGANQNNTFICGYGYGTTFTQPCMYHAMDNLGIAQYLSRLGLLLGDAEALDAGKAAWMDAPPGNPAPLRGRLPGVPRPLRALRGPERGPRRPALPAGLRRIVDEHLSVQGASAVAMLTQFMSDWFDETRKWVDAVLKVAAAESDANRDVLTEWTRAGAPALRRPWCPSSSWPLAPTPTKPSASSSPPSRRASKNRHRPLKGRHVHRIHCPANQRRHPPDHRGHRDRQPHAVVHRQPAMVKIDAEGTLVIRKSTIEEQVGRDFDLQELHINLISSPAT